MKRLSYLLISAILLAQPMTASIALADNEDAGTIIGGIIGGVIGNQFGRGSGRAGATIGGAVIGAIIGNRIGASMDEDDRREWARAHRRCLDGRANETYRWGRRDSDARGEFVYVREGYHSRTRQVCREYRSVVYYGGEREVTQGYACRTETTWRETPYREIYFGGEMSGSRPEPRGYVCYARNGRGESFRARGYDRREARSRAMDRCYEYSRYCSVESCDPIW